MSEGNGFTPTERRILNILADGQPHVLHDLHRCLNDDLSAMSTLYSHVYNLRAKLRPKGQDILCENIRRRCYYRHVRLLASPYDGRV
jgi:DNA-binding winged helix-turn-helix (wHTH) protein